MKKIFLALAFFAYTFQSFGQYDSFSTTISDPIHGNLDIVLYKYSVRGANYQIFTYDGTDITPYPNIPQIRTYRGYISNMENSKITAVWYPDNKLYIKTFLGKGEKFGFELNDIDINTLTITPLNLPINTTSKKAERHITAGFTTNYDWFTNVDYANGDMETAIAIFENGANQYDLHAARDIGTSLSIDLLVIPSQQTGTSLFKPRLSNYPNLTVTKAWWKSYGSGGGAGTAHYCDRDYSGGRSALERKGFGALPHEFGHNFGLGHYYNQKDAMNGNQFFLGRETAIKSIEHLEDNGTNCLAVNSPDYTDPIHPYTPEDYAITTSNQAVNIDVLANDVDYNGDSVSLYEFDQTSYYGGTITQNGQTLTYTPPQDFIGHDFFYYKAQSGNTQDHTYFWNFAKVSIDVRPSNDLALYYPFEGTIGNVIFNQTNNITEYNAALRKGVMDSNSNTAGVLGNCLELNTNQIGQVVLMNDILDPIDSSLSVSVWFKLNELPGIDADRVLLFDSGSGGELGHAGLSIFLSEDDIHFFAQPEGTKLKGADRFATVTWQTNVWYHAVMVVDSATHTLYGYLNGQEVGNSEFRQNFDASQVIKGFPENEKRISTAIGGRVRAKIINDPMYLLKGWLDEFKIYTKALTATEVLNEYNNPTNPTGTYNCPSGLFQESIRNASFEKEKIGKEHSKYIAKWYETHQGSDVVLWSKYSNLSPNAPDGENWARIKGLTGIYQQIGTWEPNAEYTVNFTFGKRTDVNNPDLEVSLWVGETSYPMTDRDLTDVGATKIDQVLVDASQLANTTTTAVEVVLNTDNANHACGTPVWILFQNVNMPRKISLIDDISIRKTNATSVADETLESNIFIYPNPSKQIFNISVPFSENLEVELYSIQGKTLLKTNKQVLNLTNFAKGIYFVKIKTGNITAVKRIILE